MSKTDKDRTLTPKQEAFCQALMTSKSNSEAYLQAFDTDNVSTARNAAAQLLRQDHIIKRVKELRSEAAAHNVLTRNEALSILTDIAKSQASDLIDSEGRVSIEGAKKLGRARALLGWSVSDTKYGTNISAKLANPVAAIERIAKIEGWNAAEKLTVEHVNFNLDLGGEEEEEGEGV